MSTSVRLPVSWRTRVLIGWSAATALAGGTVAQELLLERHVDERYHVLVQFTGRQMQRNIWPKFPVAIELTGSDGRTYTMRQPFELYAETRRYREPGSLEIAYDEAYAALVANGDCMPVYAGFREATFDCGDRQGMRTVAVRRDQIGDYVSTEMVAIALIPDQAEFATARSVLDTLTSEVEPQVDSTSGSDASADR